MKLPKLDITFHKKTCKPLTLSRAWSATQRALNLDHTPAGQFACCQWQTSLRPATGYLIYRWVLFVGVVSTAVASFACQKLPPTYKGDIKLNYFKWFIYFTNWGIMVIAVQAGLALAVVHRYRKEKNFNIPGEEDESALPRRPRSPALCRLYWLAHVVATDLAFVITLVYWGKVHDSVLHPVTPLNLLVHGGNSILMLVELAMTAHPFRFAHALYGACAGLVYGVFSAFYWAVGGTDPVGAPAIYPTLDWNKPGPALGFVVLCAAVMVTAHAVATGLSLLRTKMASRMRPPRSLSDRYTLPTH